MSVFQILEASGLTPGPPQRVEGGSAAEALDNWARGRGFADYAQAAEVTGCAKIAYPARGDAPAEMLADNSPSLYPARRADSYALWSHAEL
jgi:hypothetical protein